MGHTPDLIPNSTLLIQVVIFFACYFVLKALVFKPYLELLKVRAEKTIGLETRANEAVAEAAALKTKYEEHLQVERKKVQAWVEEERRKISEEERKIIQEGRDVASKELDVIRSNSQAELEKAKKELAPLVSEYASAIASKLLGRKVQVSAGDFLSKSSSRSEQAVRS